MSRYISRYSIHLVRTEQSHDDVIKWKHFPRYWPFVRGIHRSPVNSPQKGQCRGALMFCLICVWINGWINNREAGDLIGYRAQYDVIVMPFWAIDYCYNHTTFLGDHDNIFSQAEPVNSVYIYHSSISICLSKLVTQIYLVPPVNYKIPQTLKLRWKCCHVVFFASMFNNPVYLAVPWPNIESLWSRVI